MSVRHLTTILAVLFGIGPARAWAQAGVQVTAPRTLEVGSESTLAIQMLDAKGGVVATPTRLAVRVLHAGGVLQGESRLILEQGALALTVPLRASARGAWMVEVVVEGKCSVWVALTAVPGKPPGGAGQQVKRCTVGSGRATPLRDRTLREAGLVEFGSLPLPRAAPALAALQPASPSGAGGAAVAPVAPPPAPEAEDSTSGQVCDRNGAPGLVLLPSERDVRPDPDGMDRIELVAVWCGEGGPAFRQSPLRVVLLAVPPVADLTMKPETLEIPAQEIQTKSAVLAMKDPLVKDARASVMRIYAVSPEDPNLRPLATSVVHFKPAAPAGILLDAPDPPRLRALGSTDVTLGLRFTDALGRPTEPMGSEATFYVTREEGSQERFDFPLSKTATGFPVKIEGLGTHVVKAVVPGVGEATGSVWLGFDWTALLGLGLGSVLGVIMVLSWKKQWGGGARLITRSFILGTGSAVLLLLLRVFDVVPEGMFAREILRMVMEPSLANPLGPVFVGLLASMLTDTVVGHFLGSKETATARRHALHKPA